MSRILNTLVFLLLTPSLALSDSLWFNADEVEVEDGDTLLVKIENQTQRVQLIGVDAPEDSENPKFKVDLQRTALDHDSLISLGLMATNHLRELIAGRERIELQYQPGERDRYGRLQGEWLDYSGHSLNQTMIADGYAVTTLDESDSRRPQWIESQKQAFEQKLGLWGLLPKPAQLWAGKYLQP
jgi:micrococcal nuclease